MQPIIVDSEVMGDLVYHGDPDFLDHLLMGLADRQDRILEDQDAIWQVRVELTAFGEWNAGVEPQRVRQVRRRVVLDQDHTIVDQSSQLFWNLIQSLRHMHFKLFGGHRHPGTHRVFTHRSLDGRLGYVSSLDLANYIDEVLHGYSACRLAEASNRQLRVLP